MSTTLSFLSGNRLETITFDTAMVRPSFESDIAEHPIERGSDASDNARDKPEVVTIDGLLTDYPLTINGGGIGERHEKGRAVDIVRELLYLKSKGVRFRINTELRQYSNMMIRSIVPITDRMKGAVRVTIAFSRVLIVASETVNVTQVAANRSGQKREDKGKQTGKEVAAEPLKSNLSKMADSGVARKTVDVIGGLFR